MTGPLNHSQAYIIKGVLIGLTLATDPADRLAWPIFSPDLPDEPDNAIVVKDTSGRTQGRISIDGEVPEQLGFQVTVRSNSPVDGYIKAKRIAIGFDKSVKRVELSIEGSDYLVHTINRTTDALFIGFERTSRRRLWTVNALVSLRMMS